MSKYGLINNQISNLTKGADMLTLKDDFTHAMIVGQTGCGKTTSPILPILEDRIIKGHGILLFDYKGTEHQKVKYLADKHKRLKDVVMINVPWGKKINILKDSQKDVIENFLKMAFGSKDNDFWTNMATNYSMQFVNVLRYINLLNDKLRLNESLSKEHDSKVKKAKFTFASLANHFADVKNMTKIYDLTDKYYDKLERDGNLFLSFKHLSNDSEKLEKIIIDNSHLIKQAKKAFENFFEDFHQYKSESDSKIEDGKHSRFYSNYTLMISAINDIVRNEMLNEHEASIHKLLMDGKIVVVNSQDIGDNTLSLIVSSVLHNILQQINQDKKQPISVIIDEAQRVVSPNMDLHIDVLREAKCELILAFQNEEILANKLGSASIYKELAGNLTSKFFFKNAMPQYCDGEYRDFSSLSEFEYYHNGKKAKAKPMFIDKDELLVAEYRFQKINSIKQNFTNARLKRNEILVYDKSLFEDEGKFICQNIKTKAMSDISLKVDDKILEILKKQKIAYDSRTQQNIKVG